MQREGCWGRGAGERWRTYGAVSSSKRSRPRPFDTLRASCLSTRQMKMGLPIRWRFQRRRGSMRRRPSHSRPSPPAGFRRQETSSQRGGPLELAGDVGEGHVSVDAASTRRSQFSISQRFESSLPTYLVSGSDVLRRWFQLQPSSISSETTATRATRITLGVFSPDCSKSLASTSMISSKPGTSW
jgi:hypothetical protein